MNDEANDIALSVGDVLDVLGVTGVVVVLTLVLIFSDTARSATGAVVKFGVKMLRRALFRLSRRIIRYVRVTAWGARRGIGPRLAHRLQTKRWNTMCEERKFVGLKRNKVKRTKQGIAIRVTFNKAMTLEYLNTNLPALETGLGIRRKSSRVEEGAMANGATLHIAVRDPLAKAIPWEEPGQSIMDLLRLAITTFGDTIELNLCQRILIIGWSGAGKSSLQRVMAAAAILADDADLEIWDLKNGTESVHYEGLAVSRVKDVAGAIARVDHLLDEEIPRRAAVMEKLKVSTYPISPGHPARIVLVDEGNLIKRGFSAKQFERMCTLMEHGRAYGVYVWYATQFPKATNLPTELRSQFSAVVAMKMRKASESRTVFEDEVKEGWAPHTLRGKGWLMLQDEDHDKPEHAKAPFLDEKVFQKIKAVPTRPLVPVVSLHKSPKPPAAKPADEMSNYDKALQVFVQAGENGAPVAAVMQRTELGKSQAYTIVNQLVKDGHVRQIRQGRYGIKVLEGASS